MPRAANDSRNWPKRVGRKPRQQAGRNCSQAFREVRHWLFVMPDVHSIARTARPSRACMCRIAAGAEGSRLRPGGDGSRRASIHRRLLCVLGSKYL